MAAGRQRPWSVGRLWLGTAAMNLVGGWVITWIIVVSAPQLKPTAIDTASHYVQLGITAHGFALAFRGGIVITLMTWMERSSDQVLGKIAAAVVAAFLLGAGELNHVIVVSLELFAALHAGAPFGYAEWAGAAAWAGVGNTIGGVAFVTITRLLQVGRVGVEGERRRGAEQREEARRDHEDRGSGVGVPPS